MEHRSRRQTEWGEHVGAGWAPIVDRAVGDIFDTTDDVTIVQVKQKFGRLVIYTNTRTALGAAVAGAIIDAAASEAGRTCEHCGRSGTRRRTPRTAVLCARCHHAGGGHISDLETTLVAQLGADGSVLYADTFARTRQLLVSEIRRIETGDIDHAARDWWYGYRREQAIAEARGLIEVIFACGGQTADDTAALDKLEAAAPAA